MKKLFILLIFISLHFIEARAQWIPTYGPKGTHVNVIYKSGSIIFAGTHEHGVYRSTNNGGSWEPANTGIGYTNVLDIVSSGGIILASIATSCPGMLGVFKSTDNGLHWIPSSNGLNGHIVESFAVKGSYIYAAVSAVFSTGIYRSGNNGSSWEEVESPITEPNKIFVTGNNIIVSEYNFMWRSTDDGVNWDLTEQFALNGVYSFAASGGRIMGAGGSGLYVSTNQGASWTYGNIQGGVQSLSSVGNIVYLGSGNSVKKSTNSGLTWTNMSTGLGKGSMKALLYDGTNVYASTEADSSGIYMTTNGGASWNVSYTGLPVEPTIRGMIAMGNFIYAGMQGDGIYRSSNSGASWFKVGLNNDSLNNQIVFNFAKKDGILFAATAGGVYRSTDQGTTFTRIVRGFPGGGLIGVYGITVSGNNIVTAVSVSYTSSRIDGIFYSSNNGDTWQQANLPANAVNVSSVASDGSESVYAGVYTNSFQTTGLYKSTNYGISWFPKTSSINADIDFLAVKGNNVFASNLFSGFASTDAGEKWFGSAASCGAFYDYIFVNNIVFGASCSGVAMSTNQGFTWEEVNSGFIPCPLTSGEAICADGRNLYLGAYADGVWKIPLSYFGITGMAENNNSVPEKFSLEQNFPNPFNPVTKINYSLEKAGNVKLIVYDALGKEVSVLVNNTQNAGKYSVDFNGVDLSSGVYYYRLITGSFTDTKKMLLVK